MTAQTLSTLKKLLYTQLSPRPFLGDEELEFRMAAMRRSMMQRRPTIGISNAGVLNTLISGSKDAPMHRHPDSCRDAMHPELTAMLSLLSDTNPGGCQVATI